MYTDPDFVDEYVRWANQVYRDAWRFTFHDFWGQVATAKLLSQLYDVHFDAVLGPREVTTDAEINVD